MSRVNVERVTIILSAAVLRPASVRSSIYELMLASLFVSSLSSEAKVGGQTIKVSILPRLIGKGRKGT
jgi:hypothetical protein